MFTIGNYEINKSIVEILYDIKRSLHNGKLAQIVDRGDDVQVTCPHHASGMERRPSCFIRKSDGVYHCFTCNDAGGFAKFVAECFGSSIDFAERWLLDNCGYEYVGSSLNLTDISLDKQVEDKSLDESVLETFESYHPYMTQRGLNEETIKKFEIKYDPKTKCIVFPVRDVNGKLIALTRRSVESKKFIIDKDFDKKNIYLLNEAKKHKRVAIVESQFNALTSWQYGLPAVALFGCGTTYEQIEALNKTDIREFILMYDSDKAGRDGAYKFKKFIKKDKFIIDVMMPQGKDVNDLSEKEFKELLSRYGI